MITINIPDFVQCAKPCYAITEKVGGPTYCPATFLDALESKLGEDPSRHRYVTPAGHLSVRNLLYTVAYRADDVPASVRACWSDVVWFMRRVCTWHTDDPRLLALVSHIDASAIPEYYRNRYASVQPMSRISMYLTDMAPSRHLIEGLADLVGLHNFHIDKLGTYDL